MYNNIPYNGHNYIICIIFYSEHININPDIYSNCYIYIYMDILLHRMIYIFFPVEITVCRVKECTKMNGI